MMSTCLIVRVGIRENNGTGSGMLKSAFGMECAANEFAQSLSERTRKLSRYS